MIEDLALIMDCNLLNKRKNIICGSRDYVRKAAKLLVRARFKIEKIYCDDEIRDSELKGIERVSFSDGFSLKGIQKYNIIYAESDQELLDQNLKQMRFDERGHVYTYCGLYIALSVNLNKDIYDERRNRNNLDVAIGTYNFAVKWLRSIRWVEESGIELILYAMPKTGTQSMKATLNKYGFEHTYVHFMNIDALLSKQFYNYFDNKIRRLSDLLVNDRLVKENYLNVIKGKKVKIITGVREPMARNYSMVFQAIKNWGPYPLITNLNGNFEEAIINYLDYCSNSTWEWFDDEIKEIFNIDVFNYPFNKEKGYCVIKEEHVEIFLYKLENSKVLGKALAEFLGLDKKVNMLVCHEAEKEEYRFIYKQLKRILCISEVILSKYYDNDKMRHFYGEEEILQFKNNWRN